MLGGVVAYLNGGEVENCTNRAIVFGDGGTTPRGNVENGASRMGAIGGIVGNAMTGSAIANCVNETSVTCANSNKGGRAAGILGLIDGANDSVTVERCLNSGRVDSYQYAGGIVGLNFSAQALITDCANTGVITGFSSGSTYVGGIVACSAGNIENCYNIGTFGIHIDGSTGTKAAHAGGIVSDLSGPATVTNCYNTGDFDKGTSGSASSYGGICGTGYGSAAANKLVNCYTTTNSDSGFVFEDAKNNCAALKSIDDMKTADFLAALNGTGSAFVTDSAVSPINGGLPVLAFQAAAPVSTDWDQVTAFVPGETYYIASAADLAAMGALVNGGMSGAGANFVLTAGIDLQGISFTPIGTATADAEGSAYTLGNPFAGEFDGNGNTISNLVLASDNGPVALFVYSTGAIRNLTVTGSVTGKHFTAGVAALASGTVEHVVNRAVVRAQGNCVGGIVADAVGSLTIEDCHNQAVITNNGVPSERSTGRMGGIVGRVESGYTAAISACSNSADITAYQYAGGILGGSFGDVSVDACYNSGTITGISFGKVYVGGIAGKLGSGTVSNCYNVGGLQVSPWGSGHVRAVGGIVGCEENHTPGTAVTNCYSTGPISIDTSRMVSGSNFIYMVGNISGGNNSTSANTMGYSGCFYLTGALAVANPNNPGYAFWSDVYKNDPLAYDTNQITGLTEDGLKSVATLTALGASFIADSGALNGGYPVLCWQTGENAPEVVSDIETECVGGTATLTVPGFAAAGAAVDIAVSGIEAGKQLKSVTVTDASGAKLTLAGDVGSYRFTMPARPVKVTVTLETAVTSDTSYALSLPEGLDPI